MNEKTLTTNKNAKNNLIPENSFMRQLIDVREETKGLIAFFMRKNSTAVKTILEKIENKYKKDGKNPHEDGITIGFRGFVDKYLSDKKIVDTPVPVRGKRGETYNSKELEVIMVFKGLYKAFTKSRIQIMFNDPKMEQGKKETLNLNKIMNRGWLDLVIVIKDADYGIDDPCRSSCANLESDEMIIDWIDEM